MRQKVDLKAALAAASDRPVVDMTLAELVNGYAAAHPTRCKTRTAKWLDAFGEQSAWAITTEMLDTAAAALRAAGLKPSSVNRDLSSLGSAYKWAKAQRLTPRGFRSPTVDIRREAEAIRVVEVTPEQIATLKARSLATRDRRFGAFVHLLIDTGARKSELLQRRWADVDLNACTITCDTTKTGVPRVLFFKPETATLIRRAFGRAANTAEPKQLVFEGYIKGAPINFRTAWRNVVQSIGMPDLHMHDVRHAAAADLLRSGVTLGVAAQVLGHSPQVLARRYGHLETAALKAAQQQRWGRGAGQGATIPTTVVEEATA